MASTDNPEWAALRLSLLPLAGTVPCCGLNCTGPPTVDANHICVACKALCCGICRKRNADGTELERIKTFVICTQHDEAAGGVADAAVAAMLAGQQQLFDGDVEEGAVPEGAADDAAADDTGADDAVHEADAAGDNPFAEPIGRPNMAYVRSLFLAIYPEGDKVDPSRELMEEMIDDAKEGRAGAAKQSAYDRARVELAAGRGAAPGVRLAELRANFTPESIRRATRAKATFEKHQRNNERFILYLFLEHPAYLKDEFRQRMSDISTEPDFSAVDAHQPKYRKNGGRKTVAERRKEHLTKLLREEISSAIGEPGTSVNLETVDLEALEQNIDIFIQYIAGTRKANGGIMKARTYLGFRSSLTFLFRRYRRIPPRSFEIDLKECMEGVKRLSNQAVQHGEGNIHDGDRELTWALFERYNDWFIHDGSKEGVFAALFSKLTCALACRGNSTGQICTKQMKWLDDSLQIPFAHIKDSQSGDNAIKKLPRHCYANPLNFSADLPSALLHFMALNPDVIASNEESLFSGSLNAQSQRFGRFVKKISEEHKEEIETRFGFDIRDIGVHSWRKCAHTKLNCGSTAGPTAAAACIRGGHSMGANRDVYIAQEKASDRYCGRILAGLPEHSAEFATSYPDFVPIGAVQSVDGGVTEAELAQQKADVDAKVKLALQCIFGVENLAHFPTIYKLLEIGLASHLIHLEAYDKPIDEKDPDSPKLLPDSSPLRDLPLFTNPAIEALKEHVRIAMPWENDYKYFKPASGLPPHVLIFSYVRGLKADIDNIPQKLEELLDRRQMAGPLSLDQVARAVENSPRFAAMANDLSTLRAMIQDGSLAGNPASRNEPAGRRGVFPTNNMRLVCEYKHGDGKYRRVPASWRFPKLALQSVYVYWHCGDEQRNIPPMKYFDSKDVEYLGKRARIDLSEIRKVMECIDSGSRATGLAPKEIMTQIDAATCFNRGEYVIHDAVPSKTETGRNRNVARMKVPSVVRYLRKKQS